MPSTGRSKATKSSAGELKRRGKPLTISLNGEIVFDDEPEIRLGEMVFGLFHNADKASARVRNVKLRGSRPESLPQEVLSVRGAEGGGRK